MRRRASARRTFMAVLLFAVAWGLVAVRGAYDLSTADELHSVSAVEKQRDPLPLASRHDAKGPERRPSSSRLPPDVVRDYGYNASHLLNGAGAPLYASDERYAKFIARLRQYPPDVLIVGKDAPLTHSLGPILSFGGENRTYPLPPNLKKEDPRRMLSADEFRLRIRAVERFVTDVHAAGVKTVVPYISPMTAFGDAEKRLGIFQFFDEWREYEKEFRMGARPTGDPLEWTQRDVKGNTYFRIGGGREDAGGMTRYSMCVNHPGWRRWQMIVADWIERVGYDGLFMDNVLVHRCYGTYCRMVAKELGADITRDPNRVWLESYSRYFDDLRKGRGKQSDGFFLGGNYPELSNQRAVTDKLDISMVEQVWLGAARILWPGGIWTGYYPPMPNQRILTNRTRGTNEERALNNIWLSQFAYVARGERGTHLLSGAPAGKSPDFAHNEDSAILALAEGAAFGGGVAVQVTGQYPFHSDSDLAAHKARVRFHSFARSHRELYENLMPAGDVAILVFPDDEVAALIEAQQVHEALLWRGLLVDVLDGDRQSASTLAKYRLIIIPGRSDAPAWIRTLAPLQSPDPLSPQEVRGVAQTYQRREGEPQIRRTKLSDLTIERAESLRALSLPQNSFIQGTAWADERRMVLHLLNFRVPIGLGNGGKLAATADIPVRVRLPKDKRARQVRLHSTEAEGAVTIEFKQKGDTLELRVPSVRVYAVCEIVFS